MATTSFKISDAFVMENDEVGIHLPNINRQWITESEKETFYQKFFNLAELLETNILINDIYAVRVSIITKNILS